GSAEMNELLMLMGMTRLWHRHPLMCLPKVTHSALHLRMAVRASITNSSEYSAYLTSPHVWFLELEDRATDFYKDLGTTRWVIPVTEAYFFWPDTICGRRLNSFGDVIKEAASESAQNVPHWNRASRVASNPGCRPISPAKRDNRNCGVPY